jgi:hypothetical protein
VSAWPSGLSPASPHRRAIATVPPLIATSVDRLEILGDDDVSPAPDPRKSLQLATLTIAD